MVLDFIDTKYLDFDSKSDDNGNHVVCTWRSPKRGHVTRSAQDLLGESIVLFRRFASYHADCAYRLILDNRGST